MWDIKLNGNSLQETYNILFKIALFVGLSISFHFGFYSILVVFKKHILCVFVCEWCECECIYDDFHIFYLFSSCQFELWNLWLKFCSTLNLCCQNHFFFCWIVTKKVTQLHRNVFWWTCIVIMLIGFEV